MVCRITQRSQAVLCIALLAVQLASVAYIGLVLRVRLDSESDGRPPAVPPLGPAEPAAADLLREQRAAGGAPLVAGDPSWHQRAAVRFEEVQRLQGIVAVQEEELAQLRRQVQAGGAAGSLSPPRSPLPPQLAPPLEPAALEDGNNGPEDGDIDELPDAALEEPTVELEGDGPLSAELMWDSAAWPGPDRELPVRNLSHPAGRFDRPLLVRFWNYNISKPVKQPYGGEATRRWFQRYGYAETNSDDWDLLWCGKGQYKALAARGLDLPRRWQKHNHCFSAGLLAGNKHSFVVHHNEMLRHFGPQEYGHVPEMYHLPMERNSLMQAMRAEPDAVWILKPSTGARGEGIKLLSRPEQLPRLPTKDTVQRYIADPYLIEQRKVHLRLYLVIAEVAPLRLLLFKDGLALFASEEYDTNPAHHDNLFVHLTNAATMKGVAPDPTRDAEYNNGGDHEKSRLAWALRPFLQHLEAEGRDVAAIMRAVKDALVKTLLSGQARAQFAYRRPGSCFDLFGVDVMFDAAMKPYVLEINLAPQLNSPGRVNQRVHERLLYHLIGLMGKRPTAPPQFDALVKRAKAVVLAHGMPLCALWAAPEPREPQWSGQLAADVDRRGCVGEEAVHAVSCGACCSHFGFRFPCEICSPHHRLRLKSVGCERRWRAWWTRRRTSASSSASTPRPTTTTTTSTGCTPPVPPQHSASLGGGRLASWKRRVRGTPAAGWPTWSGMTRNTPPWGCAQYRRATRCQYRRCHRGQHRRHHWGQRSPHRF